MNGPICPSRAHKRNAWVVCLTEFFPTLQKANLIFYSNRLNVRSVPRTFCPKLRFCIKIIFSPPGGKIKVCPPNKIAAKRNSVPIYQPPQRVRRHRYHQWLIKRPKPNPRFSAVFQSHDIPAPPHREPPPPQSFFFSQSREMRRRLSKLCNSIDSQPCVWRIRVAAADNRKARICPRCGPSPLFPCWKHPFQIHPRAVQTIVLHHATLPNKAGTWPVRIQSHPGGWDFLNGTIFDSAFDQSRRRHRHYGRYNFNRFSWLIWHHRSSNNDKIFLDAEAPIPNPLLSKKCCHGTTDEKLSTCSSIFPCTDFARYFRSPHNRYKGTLRTSCFFKIIDSFWSRKPATDRVRTCVMRLPMQCCDEYAKASSRIHRRKRQDLWQIIIIFSSSGWNRKFSKEALRLRHSGHQRF